MLRLALIWIACPLTYAASVSVPNQTASPGDAIVVTVTFAAEGQAVSGVQFDLQWDAALDVRAAVGPQIGKSAKMLYTASPAPGTLRCIVVGLNQYVLSDGGLLTTFISVSPSSRDGSAQLRLTNAVAVSPNGDAVSLAARSATIQIQTGGTTQALTAQVVLNAASLLSGPVAPGEIVTLLVGVPEPLLSANGIKAPILYAGASQINAVVPFATDPTREVNLELRSQDRLVAQLSLPVAAASPAIFTQDQTGVGPGAILNQDLTLNSFSNPAAPGSVVMVFGTGFGPLSPAALPVLATIAGLPAEVTYSGSAPGLIDAVTQINIRIPKETPSNLAAPIVLTSGSTATPAGVTVSIR